VTRTAELTTAFMWICEDCGRDNFERAVVLSTEEAKAKGYPEELLADGEFCRAPDKVTCGHCGAEFETEDMGWDE
jgi:hypothetical protein